jgi:hypothetical protein
MNRFITNISVKLCTVVVLSAFGSARADEALPKQDEALARALENHPDIVAAKAKVALAEAELYGKRMEVSRQVLELFGNLKRLELSTVVSKAALTRFKAEFDRLDTVVKTGGATESEKAKATADVQTAEAELVHAVSQREQVEKELRLLIGSAVSPPAELKSPGKATAAVARQTPQGPIVDKLKTALDKPFKFDFQELPLQDAAITIAGKTKVPFSIQGQALEEAGLRSDELISLLTAEMPLRATLQAIEDEVSQLQFVLRDYGVLITTKDYAERHGYVPVLEPAKESASNTFKSR